LKRPRLVHLCQVAGVFKFREYQLRAVKVFVRLAEAAELIE